MTLEDKYQRDLNYCSTFKISMYQHFGSTQYLKCIQLNVIGETHRLVIISLLS